MHVSTHTLAFNVKNWAAERGIYEHSTAKAQLLKALSEAGELCDAVVKRDDAGIKDALGDVMVCLINAAELDGPETFMDMMENLGRVETAPENPNVYRGLEAEAAYVPLTLGLMFKYVDVGGRMPRTTDSVDATPPFSVPVTLLDVIFTLVLIARHQGYTLRDALESAWDEIKNRKGRMVAGGAFVKDPEPTTHPDQLTLNLADAL